MKMEECKTCKTFIYLAVIDYKRRSILTCKILKEVRIWEALLWPFPINQCGIYRKCSLIIIIHTLLQSHTHLYYGAENAAIKNHCNLFIICWYTTKIRATFVSTQIVSKYVGWAESKWKCLKLLSNLLLFKSSLSVVTIHYYDWRGLMCCSSLRNVSQTVNVLILT